jgi:hypothetical protein
MCLLGLNSGAGSTLTQATVHGNHYVTADSEPKICRTLAYGLDQLHWSASNCWASSTKEMMMLFDNSGALLTDERTKVCWRDNQRDVIIYSSDFVSCIRFASCTRFTAYIINGSSSREISEDALLSTYTVDKTHKVLCTSGIDQGNIFQELGSL